VLSEKALCVFNRNDYEPDIVYFESKKAAILPDETLHFPVPDFVVECTERNDRGVKFDDYASHGVREYWIVDPRNMTLEQFVPGADRKYNLTLKSKSGEVASIVVEGFAIPITAIFDQPTHERVMLAIAQRAL
jgi:Uma2 family endonuclease